MKQHIILSIFLFAIFDHVDIKNKPRLVTWPRRIGNSGDCITLPRKTLESMEIRDNHDWKVLSLVGAFANEPGDFPLKFYLKLFQMKISVAVFSYVQFISSFPMFNLYHLILLQRLLFKRFLKWKNKDCKRYSFKWTSATISCTVYIILIPRSNTQTLLERT